MIQIVPDPFEFFYGEIGRVFPNHAHAHDFLAEEYLARVLDAFLAWNPGPTEKGAEDPMHPEDSPSPAAMLYRSLWTAFCRVSRELPGGARYAKVKAIAEAALFAEGMLFPGITDRFLAKHYEAVGSEAYGWLVSDRMSAIDRFREAYAKLARDFRLFTEILHDVRREVWATADSITPIVMARLAKWAKERNPHFSVEITEYGVAVVIVPEKEPKGS